MEAASMSSGFTALKVLANASPRLAELAARYALLATPAHSHPLAMAPQNLTGFDPKKLAASGGQPATDPWRRYEAWRYSGPFSTRNRFRGTFPGLGIGAGAFAVYLVVEALFLKDDHAHGKEHGSGGH